MGVSLLRGILVVVGLILLVVPGVWVYVVFSVAVPVLLLEQTGVGEALGRSRELVKGRWWATFGTLLLWGVILPAIAEIAISLLLSVILNDAIHSPTAFVLIQGLKRFIAEVLFAPFGAAVVTAIYFDLRVRKEAFDIEVMATHLAQVDGRGPVTSLGLGTSDGGDGTAGLGGDGGSGGVRDPFAGG